MFVDNQGKSTGEFLFLAAGSSIGILGGIGFLYRWLWAKYLLLFLGMLNLMAVPLGTVLRLYTFWVIFKLRSETSNQSV